MFTRQRFGRPTVSQLLSLVFAVGILELFGIGEQAQVIFLILALAISL